MVKKLPITAVLLLFSLLFALPLAATERDDTTVFIDVHTAAAQIAEGATLIDAREEADFRRAHIPGAAHLPWHAFVEGQATGEVIDDDDALTRLLQSAGVSTDKAVIIYGNWSDSGAWGEEGRLFWTLEYLGHPRVFILTGGLGQWRQADLPVTSRAAALAPPAPGDFRVQRREDRRITTAELLGDLGADSLAIIDTRERVEYDGTVRYGEERPGHVPGATHLWWRDLFDDDGQLLAPHHIHATLREQGVTADSHIIAYCTGGIRSGFVYAVLRSLGYENVRNYDASMWDWARHRDAPLQ